MAKKFKPISAVPFDLIKKGHEGVAAYRERNGHPDMTIALVSALANDHKPDEIIAVSYRLGALAKFIQDGKAGKWAVPVLHQDCQLVNEALFRAAARAPLMEAKTVGDVTFDAQLFYQTVLEESEAEGRA